MKAKLIFMFSITIFFIFINQAFSTDTNIDINKVEWTKENLNILKKVDLEMVEKFFNKYISKNSDILRTNIGEYIFIDLNNDDKLELVITTDVSGRAFF
ncbi:hypothetical protein KAU33_15155 [Candidatus Dependentiae bacterium]|nr:hypothetical protein [Candidatus Dependentiae bacterium]